MQKKVLILGGAGILGCLLLLAPLVMTSRPVYYGEQVAAAEEAVPTIPTLDKHAYDAKLLQMAHVRVSASSTVEETIASSSLRWPAKGNPYPNAGALLPFNRIVAYYGNFFSTGMGILGQYPEDQVIQKLKAAVAEWEAADPSTPVIPAIHYIAVTAQAAPGADGKYRLRMPDAEIDRSIKMAEKVNGIVFIDIQLGHSTLQSELPLIKTYLAMPNVHLGIDPEFAMHQGRKPGTYIGEMDASEINYAINYLSDLAKENNIPPKILIVHRFTEEMVTNYQKIQPTPEVQVVIDMDGWGDPAKKIGTYQRVITTEPVQFTGFKLFYKNDLRPPSKRMLTPSEILNLTPAPGYIQYQ